MQQLRDGDAFDFLFPRPITGDTCTIMLNMSGKCKMTDIPIVWGTNALILNVSQTKIIVDAGMCEDAKINQNKPDKNELFTSQEKLILIF